MPKNQYITHANFYRKTRIVDGQEFTETVLCDLGWIFDCPGCLYVFPFNREEEAITTRKVHMNRCCPALLDTAVVDELHLDFTERVDAIIDGVSEYLGSISG